MKTPKRESEHRWCPIGETRDYQPTLAAKERARWKRKNRVAQLKRTIARQAEEIRNLRVLVTFKVQEEYMAEQKAALEWAAKHICAHVFADHHLETGPDGISQFTSTLPTLKFKP
jgi:hypothetical protein